MRAFAQNAAKALHHPGAFALAVLKQFRANQGLLLAGAVAYYALLSLVPLLILVVLVLTHIFEEADVLSTVGASLEFVVPGQSGALVGELRNFLAHRQTVGPVLLVMEIDPASARARVEVRDAHFFSPSLVTSQFAALESPVAEPGVLRVDALAPLAQLQAEVSAWLCSGRQT